MNRTLLKSKHSCEFSAAKKIYFILLLFCTNSAFAAGCVTVTKVAVNYKSQMVTFKLTWSGCNSSTVHTTATHLNSVWCFVDFQTVDETGNKGAWTRATISNTPSISNGTYTAGNTKGFWATGDNGQSATVTVKLGNASGKFNWCAFATDYPPQAALYSNGTYTLKGTAPFVVNGSTISGNTFTGTITSLTDATNCPGGVGRDIVHNNGTCLPFLTKVSNYCRNLIADDASTYTALGFEIKKTPMSTCVNCSPTCPTGWRYPTSNEARNMFLANSYIEWKPTAYNYLGVRTSDAIGPCNNYWSFGPAAILKFWSGAPNCANGYGYYYESIAISQICIRY